MYGYGFQPGSRSREKGVNKMGGIDISSYPQIKNDYGSFPSITKDLTTVPKDSVDVDSFVRVKPSYTYTEVDATVRGYLEGDFSMHLSPMDACVKAYYDGTMSASELQAEYETMLKKELFGSRENPAGPLTQWQKETEMDFYNAFRQKLLTAAVERNNAEGEGYITGEMNAQRSWSYYNSDYYYASQAAISAITTATQKVSEEHGSSFQVPDYLAQGETDLYNFNTALKGDPFIVSDYHYIMDPDVVSPKHFKWFFETGGDPSPSGSIKLTSFMTVDQNGNKTVIDYTTDTFDPKDPSKGRTWVSYTDEDGVEHRLGTDLVFNDSKDDLQKLSDLLFFSERDTDKAGLLHGFLSNLQLYSKGYFHRFPLPPRSMNFMV